MTVFSDELHVWYGNQLVGYLWRNQQGFIGFRYDDEWVENENFAISLSLPLAKESYAEGDNSIAHRFFANLLPEASVRAQIVRELKIPDTDFDLLRAIGGECAGALTILSIEKKPISEEEYEYELLDEEKLEYLIIRGGQIVLNNRENIKRPRLSLAGAQNKCPVLVKDNAYYLPVNEEPTSHILKFEVKDYKHVPAYETFTLWLAKEIGLPAVDANYHILNIRHYIEIKRYDRIYDGYIKRLHQEDFCQALGYGYNKKYQSDGGPSFSDCYRIVQDISSDPVIDAEHLLLWLIFNYLGGNSDGHAKNLSFLYSEDGAIRLSPFYDLVCTRAIEDIDVNLSFDIGGVTDPGQITKQHWVKLAEQCEVGKRHLLSKVLETAEKLINAIQGVEEKFEEEYGKYPALQRIRQVIDKQCTRVLKGF